MKAIIQNGRVVVANGSALTYEGSGGGVTPAEQKDVNFIDYDGTILYSYTKAEFAQLAALPANPTHTGLTAQGWNWSLSDAKTYVASYDKLWIGQMYVTSSGDTEIDCNFDDAGLLTPYLKIAVNGTAIIDWGDGSAADTVTGTSASTPLYTSHTYSAVGSYTISIHITSGQLQFVNQYILSHTNGTSNNSRRYNSCVIAVRFGSKVLSIGYEAFYNCYRLQSVTIPSGVTLINTSSFYNCWALQSLTLPNTVVSLAGAAFENCYALKNVAIPNGVTGDSAYLFDGCRTLQGVALSSGFTSIADYCCCYLSVRSITIPNSVTSIGNNAFQYCFGLQSVTIPSGVTSIGSNAFGSDHSIYKLVFKPTSPPTVSNSNAFNSLPTDCIIYVPYSADHSVLNAYTSANNYPSSSTYTYMEE